MKGAQAYKRIAGIAQLYDEAFTTNVRPGPQRGVSETRLLTPAMPATEPKDSSNFSKSNPSRNSTASYIPEKTQSYGTAAGVSSTILPAWLLPPPAAQSRSPQATSFSSNGTGRASSNGTTAEGFETTRHDGGSDRDFREGHMSNNNNNSHHLVLPASRSTYGNNNLLPTATNDVDQQFSRGRGTASQGVDSLNWPRAHWDRSPTESVAASRLRHLSELRTALQAQQDEDVNAEIQKQLQKINAGRPDDAPAAVSSGSTGFGPSGWDISGILRVGRDGKGRPPSSKSSSAGFVPDGAAFEGTLRERDLAKLKEIVEAKNQQIEGFTERIEQMETYLENERQAFQAEVDGRNRRIQSLEGELEQRCEMIQGVASQRDDLQAHVAQCRTEIERRENWICDLKAKLQRQEHKMAALENENIERRADLQQIQQKVNVLRQRCDEFDSSFRLFHAFQIMRGSARVPVTLLLQRLPHLETYHLSIFHFGSRRIINFRDVVGVEVSINGGGFGGDSWNMHSWSGRLRHWWESGNGDLPSGHYIEGRTSARTLTCEQSHGLKPTGDHWAAGNSIVSLAPTQLLQLELRDGELLVFEFQSNSALEESLNTIRSCMGASSHNDLEAAQQQKGQCLCELESFFMGETQGSSSFPCWGRNSIEGIPQLPPPPDPALRALVYDQPRRSIQTGRPPIPVPLKQLLSPAFASAPSHGGSLRSNSIDRTPYEGAPRDPPIDLPREQRVHNPDRNQDENDVMTDNFDMANLQIPPVKPLTNRFAETPAVPEQAVRRKLC